MKKAKPALPIEITGVDLFAGAGGFTLAASEAGIRIKAAVEMNAHACNTYRRNFIDGKENPPLLFSADIDTLDLETLRNDAKLKKGECDILLGGPPCQGFSTHRINGSGVDDPRNSLLLKYFEFVREMEPKFFLVENVPGILWKRHEKYLSKFIGEAERNGYDVRPPIVLNAKDFGVPQNRKRVFILGIKKGIDVHLTWPPLATHFAPDSDEVLKQKRPAWVPASTVIDRPLDPEDVNAVHMNHTNDIVELFRNTPLNGGSRADSGRILRCHKEHDGHTDVYGRIDPTKPSPTMTTACINPSKGRFVHPTEHHGITARHAARFQTFPDTFKFDGGIMASGVQIGNAVPIKLGKAVLSVLVNAIRGID